MNAIEKPKKLVPCKTESLAMASHPEKTAPSTIRMPVKRNHRGLFSAFTLTELLVTMAIIGILSSLVLSALRQVRESGRKLVCLNNQKQIGLAVHLYTNDWDGYLPPVRDPGIAYWAELPTRPIPKLAKYEGMTTTNFQSRSIATIFRCPSMPKKGKWYHDMTDYTVNVLLMPWQGHSNPAYAVFRRYSDIPNPSEIILMGDKNDQILSASEGATAFTPISYLNLLGSYHQGGANCLHLDGHVAWKQHSELTVSDVDYH